METAKKIFLVRHAKSSWADPDLEDYDRPLNHRGERDAPEMAERFVKLGVEPDLIITSGAKRALKTAEVFFKKSGLPKHKFQINDNLFHAGTDFLLSLVKEQKESVQVLMLIGHNPGLTDFANKIGDYKIDNLPTCGIYGITWHKTWHELGRNKGEMFYCDYPKKPM